jgi:hypothetical protein
MFISDPDRIRIRPKVSGPYGSGSGSGSATLITVNVLIGKKIHNEGKTLSLCIYKDCSPTPPLLLEVAVAGSNHHMPLDEEK